MNTQLSEREIKDIAWAIHEKLAAIKRSHLRKQRNFIVKVHHKSAMDIINKITAILTWKQIKSLLNATYSTGRAKRDLYDRVMNTMLNIEWPTDESKYRYDDIVNDVKTEAMDYRHNEKRIPLPVWRKALEKRLMKKYKNMIFKV